MYTVINVSVERIWPPVYSRFSFIFIFLIKDTIYSCLSYCGCIVIRLFTSIIEENTLKAPLKRLSDSRSSHIWITNVADSPRTEVMLVKGYPRSHSNDGKIVSQQWRFNTTWINRRRKVSADQSVLLWTRYRGISPPTCGFLVRHVRRRLLCHRMHWLGCHWNVVYLQKIE